MRMSAGCGLWALLCVAITCLPVHAESWLAMPTADNNILFSVDEASLAREGDVVTFWERLVYVQPAKRDEASGKLVKEKRIHRLMHCTQKTQGHDFGSLIAEDGRRIEAVTLNATEVKLTPVPPGTLAEQEWLWACAPKTR